MKGEHMRHKDLLRGVAICMVLLLILLGIILATPARAAEEAVRTNKQIALHEAADTHTHKRRPFKPYRERNGAELFARWMWMHR